MPQSDPIEPWRIVFMGTPTFSLPVLTALLQGQDPVVGIFTQPDKPTGRGLTMTPSPVKQLAMNLNIPIFQPQKLREQTVIDDFAALQPDLAVVVAYGQILPTAILTLPRYGCINVHASLLPRWRGAAPIQRALLAGDAVSGISIMQMAAGLDTGPVLAMEQLPLTPEMTGGVLHDALSQLGARLLLSTVAGLKTHTVHPLPQSQEGVVYAPKLTREDEIIVFTKPASQVQRHIHALNPWPGGVATLAGKPIKLLSCRMAYGQGEPGSILAVHEDGFEVACQEGSVILTEVQLPGKRRMTATEWMRGNPIMIGMKLQSVK